MKLYKLKNDEPHYKQLKLDSHQLYEQLSRPAKGDDTQILEDCLNLGVSSKLFPHPWEEVKADFEAMPMHPDAVQIPNISIWKGSALLLSEKAYACLKLILAKHGEFLPIDIQGYTHYIFNLTTVGTIDVEKSSFIYDEGVEFASDIENLIFDEADIEDKFLFSASHDYLGGVFCSEAFKSTCNEFDLDGLIFDEDISSIY